MRLILPRRLTNARTDHALFSGTVQYSTVQWDASDILNTTPSHYPPSLTRSLTSSYHPLTLLTPPPLLTTSIT